MTPQNPTLLSLTLLDFLFSLKLVFPFPGNIPGSLKTILENLKNSDRRRKKTDISNSQMCFTSKKNRSENCIVFGSIWALIGETLGLVSVSRLKAQRL